LNSSRLETRHELNKIGQPFAHRRATRGFGFRVPFFEGARRCSFSASVFLADHFRPAAKKAGAPIEDGQRFGLHNLRHSLNNWMVNKAKVEPKTVQGILRHAKIQTTLDL
jgi:integrase